MIHLDSAIINEAKTALKMGWVAGITTNPTLLAQSELSPAETLKQLANLNPSELYYQLYAQDFESAIAEAKKAQAIIGDKLVLKIPATPLGFQLTAHLTSEIDCSVTAIYSAAQAEVAVQAGAKYAIVYVNRATRLLGDGLALVKDMASIVEASDTEILAASIKSADEAAATLQAGAHHLTLPMTILLQMATHELSDQTVAEFTAKGTGLI